MHASQRSVNVICSMGTGVRASVKCTAHFSSLMSQVSKQQAPSFTALTSI